MFEKSLFPTSRYCDNDENRPWLYCRFPKCKSCLLSPPSGTIHAHCLQLFLVTDRDRRLVLSQLRTLLTWDRPWQDARPLDIEPFPYGAQCANLPPEFPRVPPELVSMIQQYCASSLVWLPSTVSYLHYLLTHSLPERLVPVNQILAWGRGQPLQLETERSRPNTSIYRLTFDFRGLRRIERLIKQPSVKRCKSDFQAFIVEAADRLSGVEVRFRVSCVQPCDAAT